MSALLVKKRRGLLMLLALLALGLNACSTTEPENASVRPWNAPTGWENGLPSTMTEGR